MRDRYTVLLQEYFVQVLFACTYPESAKACYYLVLAIFRNVRLLLVALRRRGAFLGKTRRTR